MKYFRFGHCKDVYVKVGDKINKGSLIGTVGTGNGQWSAHLHFDVIVSKLSSWVGYVFGMTKDQVKAIYIDPAPYMKTVMPEYDHLGFDYLEHANYGTAAVPKWCYHPGKDLNGAGAGNADLGDKIYSACDGEVIYCYDGPEKNGGWGKLIVIQEIEKNEKLDTQQVPKIEQVPEPIVEQHTVSEIQTVPEQTVPILEPKVQEIPPENSQFNWVSFILNLIKILFSKLGKK